MVALSSCKNKNEDIVLLGIWESGICSSSDIGDYTFKFNFLDHGLFELYIIPVNDDGAFVTWGEYELLGKDIIKTQAKYIGGVVEGDVVEKDEFNANEEGESGINLLEFKLENENEMVISFPTGEPVVFKKASRT